MTKPEGDPNNLHTRLKTCLQFTAMCLCILTVLVSELCVFVPYPLSMRRGSVLVAREDTSQYRLLDKNSLYNNSIDMDCAVSKPHVIT